MLLSLPLRRPGFSSSLNHLSGRTPLSATMTSLAACGGFPDALLANSGRGFPADPLAEWPLQRPGKIRSVLSHRMVFPNSTAFDSLHPRASTKSSANTFAKTRRNMPNFGFANSSLYMSL